MNFLVQIVWRTFDEGVQIYVITLDPGTSPILVPQFDEFWRVTKKLKRIYTTEIARYLKENLELNYSGTMTKLKPKS